jgi:RND family efflux transporter MFP subunit
MTHARVLLAGLLLTVLTAGGCTSNRSTSQPADAPAPIAVQAVPVVEKPVIRRLRVTGTLAADEDADVAAETAGRVMATPVERGSRVREGDPLVVLSAAEAQAQAQEAEANVAQLEARLAIGASGVFTADEVPEVKSAAASRDLAEAEFARVRNLLDQRVVSQAEYDQRRTQAEAARNQYATARNAVTQLYRQLEASRARAALARKALADTTVRAPFSGLVVERKVGVGDFVTRGTKVAAVVRVSPLRVELTVPEQSSGAMQPGRALRLTVDAYPGRTFTGTIRFVAPALRPDQRALVVEGIVANDDGVLKPGMFAAAEIEVPGGAPGLVVPSAAIQTVSGMSHVFVIRGDRVEIRMVTPGTVAGTETEVTGGLAAGDVLALGDLAALTDGARITIAAAR